MKVVVLCGGFGTRMREETEFRPKPLVRIGQQPILWHILQGYARQGFQDFVICLGYKGYMIKEYFLNYEAFTHDLSIRLGRDHHIEMISEANHHPDIRVVAADTGESTMTGGRIARIRRYVSGTFMVTYGDTVADVDIPKLLAFHRQQGKIATVTSVQPRSRFGSLKIGRDGVARSFTEKPQLDGWVSAGYFVFEPEIFQYLDGDDCVLEHSPLERLTADGQLAAYRHDGAWFPMDTYREVVMLNELWNANEAPWAPRSMS